MAFNAHFLRSTAVKLTNRRSRNYQLIVIFASILLLGLIIVRTTEQATKEMAMYYGYVLNATRINASLLAKYHTLIWQTSKSGISTSMPQSDSKNTASTGDPENTAPSTQMCNVARHQAWTTVNEDRKILFYTPVYDANFAPSVITFLVYGKGNVATECVFEQNNAGQASIVKLGRFEIVQGSSAYSPQFFTCDLPKVANESGTPDRSFKVQLRFKSLPKKVSVSIPICQPPIVPDPKSTQYARSFTMCTHSLHNYDEWYRLLTFIEYYRILGATQFIFYEHIVTPTVKRVLNYYQKIGLAQVYPWPTDQFIGEHGFVHSTNWGQVGAMNDCLLRARTISKYAAFLDQDELAITTNSAKFGPNWLYELVDGAMKNDASKIGGVQLRSVFIAERGQKIVHWPKQSAVTPETFDFANFSVPLFRPLAIGQLQQPNYRCKMIYKTNAVHKVGVHNAWTYRDGHKQTIIDPSQAVMYHVRWKENVPGATNLKDLEPNPFDPIKSELLSTVGNALNDLKRTKS